LWGKRYLCVLTQQVDQIVGIGGKAGNNCVKVLVDGIDLLGYFAFFKQEGCLVLFSGEDDTFASDNT
jgi:hypothetical protein